MIRPIVNPDGFFEEYAESPGLVKPCLIVLSVSLLSVASGTLTLSYTKQLLPPESQSMISLVFVSTAIGAFVWPFLTWGLVAGAFHVISIRFGGEGSFRRTLGIVGWGFYPKLFITLFSLVATYVVLQQLTLPASAGGAAAYAEFNRRLQQEPLVQVTSYLSVVFILWQGFVWTFGLRNARDLSIREAALTVSAPVGALLLWTLYNIL